LGCGCTLSAHTSGPLSAVRRSAKQRQQAKHTEGPPEHMCVVGCGRAGTQPTRVPHPTSPPARTTRLCQQPMHRAQRTKQSSFQSSSPRPVAAPAWCARKVRTTVAGSGHGWRPGPCGPWERWEGWGRRLPPMETCAAAAAILVALAQQLWHLRNIRAAPACDGAPQYGRRARGGCSPCTLTARAGAHRAALGPGRARSCSRQRCARRGENRFQRQPAKPPTFVRAVVGKRISRIRLQEGY
jgi:hypothetical protein